MEENFIMCSNLYVIFFVFFGFVEVVGFVGKEYFFIVDVMWFDN